jgi:hypothetical protein
MQFLESMRIRLLLNRGEMRIFAAIKFAVFCGSRMESRSIEKKRSYILLRVSYILWPNPGRELIAVILQFVQLSLLRFPILKDADSHACKTDKTFKFSLTIPLIRHIQ